MEAEPLRKFLFALVLVSAAFAGGALFSNGPLMNKARVLVAQLKVGRAFFSGGEAEEATEPGVSLDDDNKPRDLPAAPVEGEQASNSRGAELPSASDDNQRPILTTPERDASEKIDESKPVQIDASDLPRPLDPETLTSAPKVRAPAEAEPPVASPKSDAPRGESPRSAEPVPSSPEAAPPSAKENEFPDVPGSAPAVAVVPKKGSSSRAVALADLDAKKSSEDKMDPEVSRSKTTADSASSNSATKGDPASPEPPTGAAMGDWTKIKEKMRKLGVSRYTFEGDPYGQIVFRCILPIEGHKSIGQQFEAAADDPCKAAEIALRRVLLWKASEHGD